MSVLQLITARLLKSKTKSLLDVGCGYGKNAADLKKALPELYVEGIDIAKHYIQGAIKDFPSVRFRVKDARKYRSKKKFDMAFTHGFFIHVSHAKIKGTIKRVMRNAREGLFIESAGNETPGMLPYEPNSYWNSRAVRDTTDITDENTQYYFSHNYQKLFKDLGFECEILHEFNPASKTRLYYVKEKI